MIQPFIAILTAHIVADFWLQPDWMAARKRQLGILLLHTGIHAFIAWAFLSQPTNWIIPAGVFVSHLILDIAKIPFKDCRRNFLLDQLLHLIALWGVIYLAGRYAAASLPVIDPTLLRLEIWIGGAILSVYGAGILVGKSINELFEKNTDLDGLIKHEGLVNGGKIIGRLERALIFLLIMVGQPAGIGFLVAAKSVLRFGEAKENQKLAEYVLIGTFLSFGLAIAVACLTKWLLAQEIF